MHQLWKSILKAGSDLLPDFNDHLLLEFRKQKLAGIVPYMGNLFADATQDRAFNGQLQYLGYRELTPDEKIEYLKTRQIMRKCARIQDSSFALIRYDFKFEDVIYPVYLATPYLVDNAIISQDTKFYPIFPIVQRGSINRKTYELTVTVLRAAVLAFRRNIEVWVNFHDPNRAPIPATLITAKIHQRQVKGSKDPANRLPLILYHLARFPFEQVLEWYHFAPGEFMVVCTEDVKPGHVLLDIRPGYYVQVPEATLNDIHKLRFIAAYIEILKFLPRYELRDLYARDGHYYKTVLGKYTFPTCNNAGTMYDGAIKHLETTDTILDRPTKFQLEQIGIKVDDIYQLLLQIYYHIDEWLVGYDPTDLALKRIGSLEKLLSYVVTKLNQMLFSIINNKKEGLKSNIVKNFTHAISQPEDRITRSEMLRANPSVCNDNWLIAIGCQRYRSLQNTEIASDKKGEKKSSSKLPTQLLKAHPSHLVVESISHLPPSNPIASGSINPFVVIDDNGNFIMPDWYPEIQHVFD